MRFDLRVEKQQDDVRRGLKYLQQKRLDEVAVPTFDSATGVLFTLLVNIYVMSEDSE